MFLMLPYTYINYLDFTWVNDTRDIGNLISFLAYNIVKKLAKELFVNFASNVQQI